MLTMKLVINGEERSFGGELTLSALVGELGLKADRVAVELNQKIVRREDWSATTLREGDRLEVVHFVGGGSEHQRYKSLSPQVGRKRQRARETRDIT